MSVVTGEMHTAILRAYMARMASEMQSHANGGIDIPSRDQVEIILPAVAPIIAKAERERCAKLAETHEWFVGGIGTKAPGSGEAKAIADAIQALGDAT